MKKFLLLAAMVAVSAFGALPPSFTPNANSEFDMNKYMGAVPYKYSLGTQLRQAHNTAVGIYNFALVGGTNKSLVTGITLPSKAIVRSVFFDVLSTPTTAGTSELGFYVSTSVLAAPDLKGYTALASWTGRVAGTPDDTVSKMIKLTGQKQVYAVVSGSALLAGKIKVFVDYVISE